MSTAPIEEPDVLELLRKTGAILEGHFILSSGRHSDLYIEKLRAFEVPEIAQALGEALARRFKAGVVDVVLSPAVGAIVLGFATALSLGARFVFAEREGGVMRLRRGFEIRPGERVLVIEDVVTTGASVMEVLPLVPPGELVGVGLLVDRSVGGKLPVPPESLLSLPLQSWPQEDCPLCAKGVPPSAPGSRYLS